MIEYSSRIGFLRLLSLARTDSGGGLGGTQRVGAGDLGAGGQPFSTLVFELPILHITPVIHIAESEAHWTERSASAQAAAALAATQQALGGRAAEALVGHLAGTALAGGDDATPVQPLQLTTKQVGGWSVEGECYQRPVFEAAYNWRPPVEAGESGRGVESDPLSSV